MTTFGKRLSAVCLVAIFLGSAAGSGASLDSPATATEKAPTLPQDESGFEQLFNGKDLDGWSGADYSVEDGMLVCHGHHGGYLGYTKAEFANFVLRFEVKLSPGANNGQNFRTDGKVWNEIQILDDTQRPSSTGDSP